MDYLDELTGINWLLEYCKENGYSQIIYNGVVVLAFFIQIVFLLHYRNRYDISAKHTAIVLTVVYPIVYFWMLVLAWVANGFKNWGANNFVRVFVWIPLFILAIAKIMKLDARKLCDFFAPSMALEQAVGHLVCPFAGCCYGYPCSWGIWNPNQKEYLFPNQWLECGVAFLIFFYLLWYAKKRSFKGDGRVCAWFLILFGGTRFFLEFLRDNNKLFLGISNLALHAALMVIVGWIWLSVRKDLDRTAAELKAKKKKRK